MSRKVEQSVYINQSGYSIRILFILEAGEEKKEF